MAINVARWSIGLLVLLSILPCVFGLYFYLEGSEQKCFTEELPKETMVTADYTAEEWSEEAKKFVLNKDVLIEVFVNEISSGTRMYNQKLPSKGKFTFTSAESGEHAICLQTSAAGWFSTQKIRVTFDMDISDILDDTDTPENQLSDLAQRVRELNNKVGDIRREQSFHREHEMDFRNVSEAANGHTVSWTIVQLIILAITAAWQMRHLRGFFEARKMI
ncbi:emp24p/erv25p- protein [Lobosporangium transversale]|uniref:Emp24/gp25L/p24 family/GOLD-domain-containing protein n=1 Tax=Lobosporangium transversale TaxID=64571 RepID=A0A1Y2GPZ0_9FUNG|nr:emp24/gp25L/p24 family/GOLD-domain-containing protein [Lobosporangium transversale]KAF9914447.1 emp24p/erv25p- protein [Lobosporangium transversale]ORZ16757.1 emp24/gp25L/p24 family/GOLD-domain-containing protein [Lobosporangium transversale]|eukprot:XP_021881692.1 emp24/gp25L/p24 family/GOLD-domain-containing protein [Lobosporangium transversale]